MKQFILITVLCFIAETLIAQKLVTRTGRISFFSSTPVENIEAFNNEVALVLDKSSGNVAFIVPIKSFKFEKALMQEHFNENYMESDKYPRSEFKGIIADNTSINYDKAGEYKVRAKGKLTIHGVTKEVEAPGTIKVSDGKITLISKFKVKPRDYGIKIPSIVSSNIAEEIEVTVNCILNNN